MPSIPWPHDEGALHIPDPGLTLAEAIHVWGTIQHFLSTTRANGDAILEAAVEKIQDAAAEVAREHPEEHDLVMASVEMEQRFGLGG